MTLTVPTAGVSAGRAAQVRLDTPDTGATIKAFGDRMLEIQSALKKDKEDREAKRLQLDLTREVGQARLDVEQLGSADELDAAWPERIAPLRERVAAIKDPALREDLDLYLTELTDKHAFALGTKALEMRRSEREATWLGLRNELVTQAATADPATRAGLIPLGEDSINARLASGAIDAATAEAERQAFRRDVYKGAAALQIESDPQGFLTAADAGEYDNLGEDLAALRVTATNAVQAREAAAAKAAEADAKAKSDAIDKRLREMTTLIRGGFTVSDEDMLADPAVKASPVYPEVMAARALRAEKPGILLMTPDELRAERDRLKAAPVTEEWQTEKVKVLDQWLAEAEKGWASEPVATARKAGLPVAPLPELDPENPMPFAEGLVQRLSLDTYVTDKGYTKSQAILDPDERARLKTILDPKADAVPKLALAQAVLAASGGDPSRVLGALEADPVFAGAVETLRSTNDRELATSMLRGAQKIALGTVKMPSPGDRTLLFDTVTAGVFDGNPRLKAQKMAEADAIYADTARGVDFDAQSGDNGYRVPVAGVTFFDDNTAVDLYTQAIQRSNGARGDRNGEMTFGGVQIIRDAPVILPPTVSADEVTAALDTIAYQHFGGKKWNPERGSWSSDPRLGPADPLRAFKTASTKAGDVPDFGPTPQALFENTFLYRVGNTDTYQLRYTVAGRTYPVPVKGASRPFEFRLSDLVTEAKR